MASEVDITSVFWTTIYWSSIVPCRYRIRQYDLFKQTQRLSQEAGHFPRWQSFEAGTFSSSSFSNGSNEVSLRFRWLASGTKPLAEDWRELHETGSYLEPPSRISSATFLTGDLWPSSVCFPGSPRLAHVSSCSKENNSIVAILTEPTDTTNCNKGY